MLTKPCRRADFLAAARRSLTTRAELWQLAPPDRPDTSLEATFASLSDAGRQRRIAFGRGGFYLRADRVVPAARDVRFRLDFVADEQVLAGRGTVRWAESETREIGVEIAYVEDHCRDWIVGLSQHDHIRAFIPKQGDCQQEPSG